MSKLQKANIIAGIKVERQNGVLTLETIAHVSDAVIKFASGDFIELTESDRANRRAVKNDLQKYIEIWNEYTRRLEEIVDSAQKNILSELNITEKDWEDSNTYYMSQNNNELLMLHATLPQRLKAAVTSKKNLNADEFKNVLRAQIKGLESEAEKLPEIQNFVKQAEETAPIIQNRVNDMVYEEYGIEEEDILASMKENIQDQEVQQLLLKVQQATMKLMPLPEGMFWAWYRTHILKPISKLKVL